MTKQHFIALADFIKSRQWTFTHEHAEALADFCQSQNPQFKRDRWLSYIKGECRKNGGSIKKNDLDEAIAEDKRKMALAGTRV